MRTPGENGSVTLKVLATLVMFLLSDYLLAQTPSTGALNGTVQLADTQQPASGANVFLVPEAGQPISPPAHDYVMLLTEMDQPRRGEFHGTVDASGIVQMQGIRPGSYYVVVQLPGYISPEDYVAPWALAPAPNEGRSKLPAFVEKITAEPGKEAHFSLVLQRGGVIEGRVVHGSGSPAHNGGAIATEVALSLFMRKSDGTFSYGVEGAAHTDSNGNFRFEGLPGASYIVMTVLPGGMVQTARGLQGTSGEVILSGGASRISRAKVLEVTGTSVEHVNLVLPTSGLHRVTGRIQTPDGKPLDSGLIRLTPTGETDSWMGIPLNSRATPLQADGSFAFDSVTNDEYTLSLDEERPNWVPAGVTEDPEGIKMHYVPGRFARHNQQVTVSGSDPAPVVIQLQPLP